MPSIDEYTSRNLNTVNGSQRAQLLHPIYGGVLNFEVATRFLELGSLYHAYDDSLKTGEHYFN